MEWTIISSILAAFNDLAFPLFCVFLLGDALSSMLFYFHYDNLWAGKIKLLTFLFPMGKIYAVMIFISSRFFAGSKSTLLNVFFWQLYLKFIIIFMANSLGFMVWLSAYEHGFTRRCWL